MNYNESTRILLIEDNPLDAAVVSSFIEEEGPRYEIIHKISLKQGLEALESNFIDITLLDLFLPDSQGLDTFSSYHKIRPDLPVIVLTGMDDDTIALKAVKWGAQDFLVKGDFNSGLLRKAIKYAIERKKSDQRYRDLFEQSRDAIYILDTKGKIIEFNAAALELLKYSTEETQNMSIADLFLDQSEAIKMQENIEKNGSLTDYEAILVCEDNSYRECLISSTPRKNKKQEIIGYQGIIRDITELKKSQVDLKRLNARLESKVEERTKEVHAKKEELEKQHLEIKESIQYAQRIQNAILPPDKLLKKCFNDFFILMRPKNIVSGDFYWLGTQDNKVILALIDCTGHGIPGAFMSMIGYMILNQTILTEKITDPAKILQTVDLKIKDSLNQTKAESNSRDGMDMAICSIDFDKKNIEFAGAIRPLYLFRNNHLKEFPGDRLSLGGSQEQSDISFTTTAIPFIPNDTIYFFSDGYSDQFGGIHNKKISRNNFKELLNHINKLSMKDQKKELESFFQKWKGNLEQTDDILIIGIKL